MKGNGAKGPVESAQGAEGEGSHPPFADRGSMPFMKGYFATLWAVATRPGAFFAEVRPDRPVRAVLFGLLSGGVGLFLASFYAVLNRLHWWDVSRDLKLALGPGKGGTVELYLPLLSTKFSLAEALAAPLKVLVGILVGAVAMHLLLLAMRAGPRGFAVTLTTVGYAFGLTILLVLPVCGFPVVATWLALALVFGLSAAHRCSLKAAAAAVFTPGVLVIVFGLRLWLRGMFTLVEAIRSAVQGG